MAGRGEYDQYNGWPWNMPPCDCKANPHVTGFLRGRSRATRYESLDQAERDAIDHGLANLATAGEWDWWGSTADHGGFRYTRTRSGLGWALWYGPYHVGHFT